MNTREVLTTRALNYVSLDGDVRELVLTVFKPFERDEYEWECGHTFTSPFDRKNPDITGGDYLGALLMCLAFAKQWVKAYDLGQRAAWKGRLDCGLPTFVDTPTEWTLREIPPPAEWEEGLEVLGARGFGGGYGEGAAPTVIATIFVPRKAEGDTWRCGVTFGAIKSAPIRYGVGKDYIEAFLDAVSIARSILEKDAPKGSAISDDLQTSYDMPYKVNGSFFIDFSRVNKHTPPPVGT